MDQTTSQLIEYLRQEHRGCISEFETPRHPHVATECAICIFINRVRSAEEHGVAALQTTNSRYVALAQAWRKLADDSSDARYSAVLYGCADDLCQLNAEK